MSEQGYVLDGIKTAYEEQTSKRGSRTIRCPCGFNHTDKPALRFHYQNCIQARIPDVEREDTTFACRHGVIYSAHCDECMAEDVDSEA